jgi:hypothetical protein
MALTHAKIKTQAEAVQAVCNEVASLLTRVHQLLEHNSDQAIDWAASQKPAYISEDADGNLLGLTFSRGSVANAVGSLAAIRTLITGGTLEAWQHPGDHLGNINQLARPLG